jgi:hypothetical protein
MRRWVALAAMAVLAGCSSKSPKAPASDSQAGVTQAPAQAFTQAQPAQTPPGQVPPTQPPPPQTAGMNPEPVAPPEPGTPPAIAAAPAPAGVPAYAPREMRIPSGAILRVRLDRTIDTRRNRAGDRFTATLSRPVVAHGVTVMKAGARLRGHVTRSEASGRLKGRAVLAVTLDSFESGGREYRIRTTEVERLGKRLKGRNEKFIGGGAGLGAIVGAIAGGAKGAVVGAAAGAGAGTAGAAATRKEEIRLPAEALLVFRVR